MEFLYWNTINVTLLVKKKKPVNCKASHKAPEAERLYNQGVAGHVGEGGSGGKHRCFDLLSCLPT